MPPNGPVFKEVRFSELFKKQYKKLEPTLKNAVTELLTDLSKNPLPQTLRFHRLTGYKNPKKYTVDLLSNKSYKVSLEIDGEAAILRKIGTHKEIDREP